MRKMKKHRNKRTYVVYCYPVNCELLILNAKIAVFSSIILFVIVNITEVEQGKAKGEGQQHGFV